jgi:hypothetical protein
MFMYFAVVIAVVVAIAMACTQYIEFRSVSRSRVSLDVQKARADWCHEVHITTQLAEELMVNKELGLGSLLKTSQSIARSR